MGVSVQIVGRVARDPENRNGVVSFSIAVDQGFGDKKRGVFWSAKAFGKTGERIAQYYGKGKPIFATGRLEEDAWEKDGQTHRRAVIVVQEAEFLPRDSTQQQSAPSSPRQADPAPGDFGEDIPF